MKRETRSVPRPLAGLRVGLLSAWTSRRGGGVFESVVNQATMVRGLGGVPIVFGLADEFTDVDCRRLGPDVVIQALVGIGPATPAYAPGMSRALRDAKLDCLHLHGIWSLPSQAAANWARATRRPYLISPHGMLDQWILSRGRLKKWLAMLVYERRSWKLATQFHALTQQEAIEIEKATGRKANLVIPNAAPPLVPGAQTLPACHFLYLGRIHRKKNIDGLLAGWKLARKPPCAKLLIAGWGGDEELASLKVRLQEHDDSVVFLGPVFGEQKQAILSQSRFKVLPSFGEGLPMVVLEAWASGLPTLMTSECNLPSGYSAGAAWQCGHTASDIAAAIERACAIEESEWLQMSRAAQELVAGPFSPVEVSARWAQVYRDLFDCRNS